MLRTLCLLACLAAPLTAAQTPTAEVSAASSDVLHTFQVVDGQVHLDGILVPGAVPDDLDLAGLSTPPLEYVGPVAPVIEVNGQAYVFEGGRLVLLTESSRAGRGVFMMGDLVPEASLAEAVSDDALDLVTEEVYLRDVAGRDRGLYEKLHLERTLEVDALRLAEQVRTAEPGAERTRLRSELRNLLSRLLTLKQEVRREEVARAQAELDALKAAIDHRDAQHEQIVDARLRELCDD